MTAEAIIAVWKSQLEQKVLPYLVMACHDGHGLQVVLHVNSEGHPKSPKFTVTTGQK